MNVPYKEIDDERFRKVEEVADGGDEYPFHGGAGQHLLEHVSEVLNDEYARRPGIRELMLEFRCGIQRVGVDDGEPGAQCAEQRNRVLEHVRQHDGETIALAKTGMLQPGSEGPCLLVELAESHLRAHLHVGDALCVRRT